MFRSLPDRNRWHFCENCPAWPWDEDDFETDDEPPRERWCQTCVRMYIAGSGDLPEGAVDACGFPTTVFVGLCDAFSAEKLDLRKDDPRATPAMHAALAGLVEILKP